MDNVLSFRLAANGIWINNGLLFESKATGILTNHDLLFKPKASCRRQHALTFRSADGRSERRATGN